jgi:4a-hydroxytetrahydrobiopterin dehydratase
MTELAQKTCTPCRGGVPPLEPDAAKTFLKDVPGWELLEAHGAPARKIQRGYRFSDFREALAFVDRVGALAEAEGHHPDISFGWGYATISLHTHKIKGLHENDFILAAKIDQLVPVTARA